ncbi:uncharacterized protein LOC120120739 [Hibiscus syriacus]|uniref:uncharacterized protein LOC120120739 n=1 Tax=Hibiscus syriacus TaxID=106335 RepID=UPI001924E5AF|nr:uncharacterized protein LOC120120739 [Hibiscus syriacus]
MIDSTVPSHEGKEESHASLAGDTSDDFIPDFEYKFSTDVELEKNIPAKDLEIGVRVSSPLGLDVFVDKVHQQCPMVLQGQIFLADSMELPFQEFNVILGMDWILEHDDSLRCKASLEIVESMVQSLLCSCVDTRFSISMLKDIRTMQKFNDVFSEELPGLLSDCEVEFSIEVLPSSSLVYIAPYLMVGIELKE